MKPSADFCLWLREELEAEAAGRRPIPTSRPPRTIHLTDLEALGLLVVCMHRQGDAGTSEMALQLALVLLARLDA